MDPVPECLVFFEHPDYLNCYLLVRMPLFQSRNTIFHCFLDGEGKSLLYLTAGLVGSRFHHSVPNVLPSLLSFLLSLYPGLCFPSPPQWILRLASLVHSQLTP